MISKIKHICPIIIAVSVFFLMIPADAVIAVTVFRPAEIWDGSVADGFASGSGTENDPFIIESASQLAYLARSVSSGTAYKGEYIKLTNDIVLNDTSNWLSWGTAAPDNSWTAIGKSDEFSFCGTFDGDGHTVGGIYINNTNNY